MYANKNREKELVPPDLRPSSEVKGRMNLSGGDGVLPGRGWLCNTWSPRLLLQKSQAVKMQERQRMSGPGMCR